MGLSNLPDDVTLRMIDDTAKCTSDCTDCSEPTEYVCSRCKMPLCELCGAANLCRLCLDDLAEDDWYTS